MTPGDASQITLRPGWALLRLAVGAVTGATFTSAAVLGAGLRFEDGANGVSLALMTFPFALLLWILAMMFVAAPALVILHLLGARGPVGLLLIGGAGAGAVGLAIEMTGEGAFNAGAPSLFFGLGAIVGLVIHRFAYGED